MTLFSLDAFAIDLQPYNYKIDELFYKRCAGCHGTNGQKEALGRSHIINQMDRERLLKSMHGYQNGTYGGALKGLMKGQLKDLSLKQIDLLATYIDAMSSDKRAFSTIVTIKQSKQTIKQPTRSSYRTPAKKPPLSMKIKSKRYSNGVVKMKALILHQMITVEMAKKRGVKPTYVERIRIKEDDHLLIEMKTTAYLSRNPIFKIRYKSFGGRSISMDVKDSESQTNEGIVRIKNVSRSSETPEVEIDREKRTESKVSRRFISEYFSGAALTESDEIMLKVPSVGSNAMAVPVGILSLINAKSVTLFATQEDDRVKMVCQWVLHDSKMIDFEVKIKLRNMSEHVGMGWPSGVVSVVVEGEDKKHYIVEKDVSVAIGGSEG